MKFQPQPVVMKPRKAHIQSQKTQCQPRNQMPQNPLKTLADPLMFRWLVWCLRMTSNTRHNGHDRRWLRGYYLSSRPSESHLRREDLWGWRIGAIWELIKKCALCKKEFKSDNVVYMYSDNPFCSSNCCNNKITLDRFNRKDFGLDKVDQKTMKSLRKDLNVLHMHL